MNDQTRELIEKLATQFGASADRIWAALLKQAPINSTIDTILLAVWAAALFIGWKLVRRNCKEGGCWENDAWVWFALGCVTFVFFLTLCCTLGSIASGFFNPDYWALKEVLGNQ